MKLSLEAKNKQEEIILAYLQANASYALAEKINNGTPLTKDGKTFTNKKTLSGFMKYACDEAKKLAEKGANCACVEDSVVFGWAIHYFEEDSIEGTLYTLDGEIYKPAPKITATRQAPTPVVSPAKPQNVQSSLFDMLTQPSGQSEQADEENQDETEPPTQEDFREAFASMQNTVDEETGEILNTSGCKFQTSLFIRAYKSTILFPLIPRFITSYLLGFILYKSLATKIGYPLP